MECFLSLQAFHVSPVRLGRTKKNDKIRNVHQILCFSNMYILDILDDGTSSVCTEVGIYKRKQESKKERKHAFY